MAAAVFISYNNRDRVLAGRVRTWLASRGFASVFVDFDPARGIPAGRRWENELYAELRKADVVVYLGTRSAAASRWCFAEVAMARSLGKAVVPLVVEDAGEHELLADTQAVRVDGDGDHALLALGQALERLDADPLQTLEWNPQLPPYPGLLPFDKRRAGVFFGRDSEIAAVLERLTWPHAQGSERLVVVAGSSGSGKSSLVLAGVLPRLSIMRERWVVLPPFTPQGAPLERLTQAFLSAFADCGRPLPHDEVFERLERGGNELARLASDLREASSASGSVVICVDQAEELATQSPVVERIAFLNTLGEALGGPSPVRVVATLRSEYLSDVVAATALEGQALPAVTVGRLSPGRLAEVIERPARRAGLEFDAELVQTMVEETLSGAGSGGDPLPLLAFTLRQVYDRRTGRRRIGRADYERTGGIVGALRTEAQTVYDKFRRRGDEELVISTLLTLVHVEPDREPASRSVPRAHFDATRSEVIDAFRDAHLLTTQGDEPAVSVAHEALLREWPVLERAIERSRDVLIERSRVERDAREWDRDGRDASDLLRRQRLLAARAALSADTAEPDPVLFDFMAASEQSARREAWGLRALITLAGLVVLAALAGSVLYATDLLRERSRKADARAALIDFPGSSRLAAFAIDGHEVTFEQYRQCIREGRCVRPPDTGWAGDPNVAAAATTPVVMVDAEQAIAFCRWIGRNLPTLAQLEEAAPRVRHLLDHIDGGGEEWTSTKRGSGHRAVMHDPETGRTQTVGVNAAYRDENLGFRCAS